MSENPAKEPMPEHQADPRVTTCLNCHSPMPRELRFCRNCGYRLGEGTAEYTETVRFSTAPKTPFGAGQTSPAGPLVTSYGLSDAVAGAAGRRSKKRKKLNGMTWIFLGLLTFFIIAAAFTAIVTPIRRAGVSIPGAPPVATKLSYVGVDAFDTAENGVTFNNVEPPGSPADKAGLVGGDVIVSFDGQTVKDEDELTSLVGSTPAGKTVDVVYIRDGETKTTKLTTVSREEFRRLEDAFSKRPEGKGRFGYDDGDAETVPVPGTKISGVRLNDGAISPSLPADMAGVKNGDIVIEFDGAPIRTPDELSWRVRRAIPYSTVKVVLMRGSEKLEIPVKMGKQ